MTVFWFVLCRPNVETDMAMGDYRVEGITERLVSVKINVLLCREARGKCCQCPSQCPGYSFLVLLPWQQFLWQPADKIEHIDSIFSFIPPAKSLFGSCPLPCNSSLPLLLFTLLSLKQSPEERRNFANSIRLRPPLSGSSTRVCACAGPSFCSTVQSVTMLVSPELLS